MGIKKRIRSSAHLVCLVIVIVLAVSAGIMYGSSFAPRQPGASGSW
ncbi:hypothetical protein XccvBFoX7_gp57c [Xanthomonas phage FoX7]|uniref:Uncharacterized protein n=3 Tax=Carpasinavirus XcP1 TaxID=2182344 RepID=A0A858NQD7_9CAUD|nr:hypothetical protein HOV04_gp53 [Xanthomonas phage XcP1]AWN08555.1 hypothetical protein XcP1_053 [Xanthomonas phage XcP1]QJB22115.1 hypothetical protein XccvBFoX6_gp57c [Xanthomonas phage FoX6]QJB22214.1 hypothetical protein XccvBFoX7_gp57c [Xanthomonas phage FoX7]